jgi:hypothetical protein
LRQRIVFLGGEVEDFGADALVGGHCISSRVQ